VKNKKLIILFISILLLCGCTKQLEDKEGNKVVNETTGQNVTENIMCRPTDEASIKLYEENKIDISKLPECSEMKITGEYEGLWNSFFVRPLAYIIIKLGNLVDSYAISLIIITILMRLILYPVTRKTAIQSEKMKEAQPEINRLEKKYENKTSQEEQMMKSQELMAIYQKYKINPISGCLMAFIQLPLFFAFLEAINRVPAIFEDTFLTLQLGTTPLIAISQGSYQYLILNILIALTTYFSFKNTTKDTAAVNGDKQQKMMTTIMTVFIIFVSFSLSSAIAIYWIISSLFTIIQNILVKRGKNNVRKA